MAVIGRWRARQFMAAQAELETLAADRLSGRFWSISVHRTLVQGSHSAGHHCFRVLSEPKPAGHGAGAYFRLLGLIRYFAPVARLPYTAISSSLSASASEISLV